MQLLPPEDNDNMIIVAVTSNGWITPELKHAWFCHVRSHPQFPDPDKPVLWQFDGHFTNYEPDFVITATSWKVEQERADYQHAWY